LKNILQILLNSYGKAYSSPKSFNNQFGVPLSLSNLGLEHNFGIFEVGMSKSGEIDNLSKIIQPNIALITNVSPAHLENFNSIKGIADAKSEIIENIKKDGSLVLNRDDKFFKLMNNKAKFKNLNVVTFGKHIQSDICLKKIYNTGNFKTLLIKSENSILKIKIADVNVYNILASLAVLKILNLNPNKSKKNFEKFHPSDGRGKIHKIRRYKKKFTLVDESYNASPLSVKNAINSFSTIKKGNNKKYLILGDMLELGKRSDYFHQNLSKLINTSDIDKVFVFGQKTIFTYKNIKKSKRGNILQCEEDVDLILKNIIANNDYLMIKGSNATGLNKISKIMIRGA